MKCQYCKREIEDLPRHYAGDNCPGIVEALGAITPEGKKLEKKFGNVHGHASPVERASILNESAVVRQRRRRINYVRRTNGRI